MISVYARADHSWDIGHGYVVLLVRCKSTFVVEAVTAKLRAGFKGCPGATYAEGTLGDWYGGRFDYLLTLTGTEVEDDFGAMGATLFQSRGDNRFIGLYDAEAVLAA